MLDFFSSIADFIGTAVDAIINNVTGFLKVIQLIPISQTFLWETLNNLPPEINMFCGLAITISVVFLFLGR